MLYWCSFWSDADDYRPLHFPPTDTRILGWWCSGEDEDGRSSLCLLISAIDEEQVKELVKVEWPEAEGAEWRFIQRHGCDEALCDRFPLSDWMKPRFDAVGAVRDKEA